MTIVESGWNVWVWLVGVVNRRWVWLVGVGGCGEQEVGVASGSGWVWLVGVVVRRYSAGHQESKRVENAFFFHSMYIFSVILHASDKHDIST